MLTVTELLSKAGPQDYSAIRKTLSELLLPSSSITGTLKLIKTIIQLYLLLNYYQLTQLCSNASPKLFSLEAISRL